MISGDEQNYLRICWLIGDVVTGIVRQFFDQQFHNVSSLLKNKQSQINKLKTKRVVTNTMWKVLYTANRQIPVTSTDMDISLMMVLIRNFGKVAPNDLVNLNQLVTWRNEIIHDYGKTSQLKTAKYNAFVANFTQSIIQLGGVEWQGAIDKVVTGYMDLNLAEDYSNEIEREYKEEKELKAEVAELHQKLDKVNLEIQKLGQQQVVHDINRNAECSNRVIPPEQGGSAARSRTSLIDDPDGFTDISGEWLFITDSLRAKDVILITDMPKEVEYKQICNLPVRKKDRATFSPSDVIKLNDGRLAVCDDVNDAIYIFALKRQRVRFYLESKFTGGDGDFALKSPIRMAQWRNYLLVLMRARNEVYLYQTDDGYPVTSLTLRKTHRGFLTAVAVRDDDVYIGNSRCVEHYRFTEDAERIRIIPKHRRYMLKNFEFWVSHLNVTGDGDVIASTGWQNELYFWKKGKSEPVAVEAFQNPRGISLDPDGNVLVAEFDTRAIWRIPVSPGRLHVDKKETVLDARSLNDGPSCIVETDDTNVFVANTSARRVTHFYKGDPPSEMSCTII
ncbi:uncharacterized protein LOC141912641 [Tubulanus polymorphus]|uniref:uncharacterized protein LOC141912641 n=1 Tax=Tubulanus polymorphus TaxID=672921 RepID=UPI003DA55DF7